MLGTVLLPGSFVFRASDWTSFMGKHSVSGDAFQNAGSLTLTQVNF